VSGARYVVLEGIDGCGKTLQLEMLRRRMMAAGVTAIELAEPSYGPTGRPIRRRLLDGSMGDANEQRRLFDADRIEHVATKIGPALAFVRAHPSFALIQSRGYISAAAYQGGDLEQTLTEQRSLTPAPDRIVILDVEPSVALTRIAGSRRPDMFEKEKFLEQVAERYRKICTIDSLCVLIDGHGSPEDVADRVAHAICWKIDGEIA
jgi:dTMP kinase